MSFGPVVHSALGYRNEMAGPGFVDEVRRTGRTKYAANPFDSKVQSVPTGPPQYYQATMVGNQSAWVIPLTGPFPNAPQQPTYGLKYFPQQEPTTTNSPEDGDGFVLSATLAAAKQNLINYDNRAKAAPRLEPDNADLLASKLENEVNEAQLLARIQQLEQLGYTPEEISEALKEIRRNRIEAILTGPQTINSTTRDAGIIGALNAIEQRVNDNMLRRYAAATTLPGDGGTSSVHTSVASAVPSDILSLSRHSSDNGLLPLHTDAARRYHELRRGLREFYDNERRAGYYPETSSQYERDQAVGDVIGHSPRTTSSGGTSYGVERTYNRRHAAETIAAEAHSGESRARARPSGARTHFEPRNIEAEITRDSPTLASARMNQRFRARQYRLQNPFG